MLEKPICPDCGDDGEKLITTKAKLYGIPQAELEVYPDLNIPYWTGEWYCPKCHRIIQQRKKEVKDE